MRKDENQTPSDSAAPISAPPMTYRQYLIGCALQGAAVHTDVRPDQVAEAAIKIADAVIQLRALASWRGEVDAPPQEDSAAVALLIKARERAGMTLRERTEHKAVHAAQTLWSKVLTALAKAGYQVDDGVIASPGTASRGVAFKGANANGIHLVRLSVGQESPIDVPLLYDPAIEHFVGVGRRNALDVVVEAIVAGLGLSVGALGERGHVHRRELHDQVGVSPVGGTHDEKQIEEPPKPESPERA